ncbi:hypothetical protein D3C78_1544250 [compost metagenome]
MLEARIKNIRIAGFFPIHISKANAEADGVQLELALPNPRRHVRFVGCIPMPVVGVFIECVRIRIDKNHFHMAFNQTGNNALKLLVFRRQRNIMNDLLDGIAQPHSWNISGDDKSSAVGHQLCCCFKRIGKTVFEQLK